MLATAGRLPTSDTGWAYEFKWDGVRAIVTIADPDTAAPRVRAASRTGKDLTLTFPELQDLADALGAHSAVLDGEVVAFDDAGRPSFGRLQRRLNLGSEALVSRRSGEVPVSYLAFDVLRLDEQPLVEATYDERRAVLAGLGLNGPTFATPARFADAAGTDVLNAARGAGLEGVVAKRRASRYQPGTRSTDWIKIKIIRTQEVVLGGWSDGAGEREGSLGALLLGVPDDDGGLRYAGKVGTGFDARARRALLAELGPLESATSPFAEGSGPPAGAGIHFVDAALVGEVAYSEWTASGHLRHPTWRGRRVDKDPADVVREPPPGGSS
jgi:bifunctional non-homologous end joining protein LigD